MLEPHLAGALDQPRPSRNDPSAISTSAIATRLRGRSLVALPHARQVGNALHIRSSMGANNSPATPPNSAHPVGGRSGSREDQHMGIRNAACGVALAALLPALAVAQGTPANGTIHRWDGQRWVQVPGAATRIGVAPDGTAWVVNAAGEIFRLAREGFVQVPGAAKDIALGGDGTPWVIGSDDRVHRWNVRSWDRLDGRGIAIAVEHLGVPWLVDAGGRIYHGFNNSFQPYAGNARDIGAGTDVWVVGSDGALHQLTPNGWAARGGSAVRVSAGAPGTAWVVNAAGEIYVFENGSFRRVPGEATDIAANVNGDVWIVGPGGTAGGGGRRGAFPRR
jgi:hypothetical protein